MSVAEEFTLDFARSERIGLEEAIFCAGKSPEQIDAILESARARGASLLLTRLDPEKRDRLDAAARLDYCPVSRTAVFGEAPRITGPARVAVVAAGTSDVPVAREALRVLAYAGRAAALFADVGVAAGGRAALDAVLASCAPGITVVNIDNGYGAACAALRLLHAAGRLAAETER